MIEPGIRKVRGDMECRTVLCRRQVVDMLACRRYAIMARHTVVCDTGVIENRGHEGTAGHVADVAILRGRHMRRIDLGVLTGCINAIMAGVTPGSPHLWAVMVDKRIGKIARVMAHGTITAGVLMNRSIRRCPGTVQANVDKIAVVAGFTAAGYTRVCKIRRRESGDCVTAVAILGRRYVTCRLQQFRPGGQELNIVAALTTARDARMNTKQERC